MSDSSGSRGVVVSDVTRAFLVGSDVEVIVLDVDASGRRHQPAFSLARPKAGTAPN